LRIALIVTDLSPPRIGGISKVATSLAENLGNSGHEVVVYTLERSASLHEGKSYQVIPVRPRWMLYSDYPVVSFSLSAFKRVLEDHRKEAFDVSHAMNFNNFALTFYRRSMSKEGLAHVSTAFETTQMEIRAKWKDFLEKPGIHNLAQIVMECLLAPWQRSYIGWGDAICTEDEETREGLAEMGIPPENVDLIPSGVQLSDYLGFDSPSPQKGLYWLCPGRVDPRKGNPTLIRAYAKLVNSGALPPPLFFVGGGRGDHLQGMRTLSHELGVDGQIHFTGKVDDLRPWYQHAQAVLLPSLSEGIPITLQEALAFNQKIVCSKLKGTYAFASQVSSIKWAEPGSQENWQQALSALLRSGESSIKGEGQKFMKDHDWPKVAKRYLKLYEKAIQKLKAFAK
jgi:glycosyltransferase involved in cell wall biosynthesis